VDVTPQRMHAVRRQAWMALGRIALVAAVLGFAYSLLPLDVGLALGLLMLAASLAVLAALTLWHTRSIRRSPHPGLRAIEALATSVPFLLLSFSAAYGLLENKSAGSFGQPLTRLDAFYFTLSTFATVGFGDITAHSETARAVVAGQIIVDLVYLGLAVRVMVAAAKLSRGDAADDADAADDVAGSERPSAG